MATIATYEVELNTVTKNLEQSRATYLSLQKQYQEQCSMYIRTNELHHLLKKTPFYSPQLPPKNTVVILDRERKQFAVLRTLPLFTKLMLSNRLENVKYMKIASLYSNAISKFYRLRRHS